MNADETRLWINTTAARFPALGDFFAKIEDADVPKVKNDWAIAVEPVEPEASSRFLHAMIAGEVEIPKYTGEWATLPATLRRWARENGKPDLSVPNYRKAADDPSYRCLACRDRGHGVEVFNPRWVRHNELAIENGLEGQWWQAARKWCAEQRCGPFTFSMDCGACDKGRKQMDVRKVRRDGYTPELYCLVPGGGPDFWADALAAFVAEHPMLDNSAWVPTQSYSDVTGEEY